MPACRRRAGLFPLGGRSPLGRRDGTGPERRHGPRVEAEGRGGIFAGGDGSVTEAARPERGEKYGDEGGCDPVADKEFYRQVRPVNFEAPRIFARTYVRLRKVFQGFE